MAIRTSSNNYFPLIKGLLRINIFDSNFIIVLLSLIYVCDVIKVPKVIVIKYYKKLDLESPKLIENISY